MRSRDTSGWNKSVLLLLLKVLRTKVWVVLSKMHSFLRAGRARRWRIRLGGVACGTGRILATILSGVAKRYEPRRSGAGAVSVSAAWAMILRCRSTRNPDTNACTLTPTRREAESLPLPTLSNGMVPIF